MLRLPNLSRHRALWLACTCGYWQGVEAQRCAVAAGALRDAAPPTICRIELVATRIGHYLLTIGKRNSLCYHPSIPGGLEEWVLAHDLRPHSFSNFSPTKLQNSICSLTKFK